LDPITNLVVNEISLVDGNTSIDFMFDKPSGVVGGYYLYTSSTGAEIITPGYSVWVVSGNLNMARHALAGCGTQTTALSFGGNFLLVTTEKFNTSTWTTNAGWDLNTPRYGLAGAGTQSAALSFGGSVPTKTAITEKFDGSTWTANGSWNLNTSRNGLAGCGIQSAALSFGGNNGSSTAYPATEKFDGSSWVVSGNLNTARWALGGAGTQSAAVSFGGNTGLSSSVTENFNGSTWSTSGNLNKSRRAIGGCGSQLEAISFGGANDAYAKLGDTEKYNGSIWIVLNSLNTARQGLAGSGTQLAALSFGGTTGSASAVTEKSNQIDPVYNYSGFVYIDARVDSSHRKDSNISTHDDFYGKTHFYYTFSDENYQGRVLNFCISAVSTLLIESAPSPVVTLSTYPQKPENIFCIYDNYESDISWDSITTSTINILTWTMNSGWNLNESKSGLSGCGMSSSSLCAGGDSSGGVLATTEKFDGSTWTTNSGWNLLLGVYNSSLSGTQSAAVISAGYNPSYSPTNWSELFNGSSWSVTGGLGVAKVSTAGVGIQSAALSIGGFSGVVLPYTEKFNGSAWSTLLAWNLNTARQLLAGSGIQSAALSFGGTTGSVSAVTEKFNGSTWTTNSGWNLNIARSGLAGGGVQSATLAFGGYNVTYSAITEEFNGSTWSISRNLNVAKSTLAGTGTTTSAIGFGGNSGIHSNTTEKFGYFDISFGRNSDFNRFDIYINNLDEVHGTTMTYDVLYNSSFVEGKAVWVIDIFKRNQWFGEVTSTGALDLALIKREQYSSLTDSPFLDNFKIYVESSSDTFVGSTTSTGLVDTSFVKGYHSIYKLQSVTSTGLGSEFSKFPVYLVDVSNTLPYLRSPVNSSTGLLSNIYWEQIKNTLIDKNYYDKSLYAIPYSATETFNFKGFLGVSRCLVDIFINDIYGFTISTGIYGEYDINYKFEKGQTDLRIQARDRENIAFSRTTGTYSIRTIYIYTWYSVLGNQYAQIVDELGYLRTDNSLSTVRYSSYTDRYKPLIELSKYAEEDSTEFLTLAANIFKMFEYVSYDESVNILLDSIQTEADYFDHYDVFYRNSLYRTIKTGWNFVTISTSTGLDRGNYYYGITSLTSTGEETGVEVIRVDDRWWPLSSTGFVRMNVIQWSQVNGIPYYNIYRGVSEDSLEYVTTLSGLFFIDAGVLTPNPLKVPPVHNFTDYEAPTELSIYLDTRLAPYEMLLKNKTWVQIVIYAEDDNDIPEFQLERIVFYLKKIIAPEIIYTVIYANDSSVRFLT